MVYNESGNKKVLVICVRFVNVINVIMYINFDLLVLKQEVFSFNVEMVIGQVELLFWEFIFIINID